ncbi:hypothetical protein C8F04DRAFT_1009438 [Mycena alexandri]|uniref:F-box domain-containing protein n=1 Tax=Mycena alexandri TaxID=1745969 RepID=A0AAD6WSW5_9AGAR|nr:hypothetical protein C8F04DRAFT_1009438 [Mycena alexandri]
MSTTTTCANREFQDPPAATNPPRGSPKWRDSQRARLASTRQQIWTLEARLEILDAERQELEKNLETFTYPVISTPAELVSEIFLACLPDNGRVQPSRHAAPLSLSQICRHWREIALSTPQLWSSVDFTFQRGFTMGGDPDIRIRNVSFYSDEDDSDDSDSERDSPYDGACALVRTWFHRAKGCPVSVTLRCSPNRTMPPKIFSAIAEFSAQWGRLELTLPLSDIPSLEAIRGPFPELQSLAIDISTARSFSQVTRLTGFLAAPRLRTVRLFSFHLTLNNVLVDSAQVTSLELKEHLSKLAWTAIFTRFPTLRHFTAGLSFDESDPTAFKSVPPLESLCIDPSEDPLGMLTLPHLRRLKYYIDTARAGRLLAFLSRSTCLLTHLTLRTYSVDDDTLLKCLRAVPHLITLELERYSRNRGLYEHLQAPVLLPRLQHLAIAESGRDYKYEPVFTMLRVRRASHPGPNPEATVRLRTFDLTLDVKDLDSDDDEAAPVGPVGSIALQLQRFAADSLRVRVHTQTHKWPVARDDEKDFP